MKEDALLFIQKYYNTNIKVKLLDQVYGKTLYLNDSLYDAYITFDNLYKSGDSSKITTKFLGLCSWKVSCFNKGVNYLEKYIQKDTTDYMVYYVLSVCCKRCHNPQAAIKYMEKSFKLYSLDTYTLCMMYQNMAESYSAIKDYNNSIINYKMIIENDPDNYYGEYSIARLYDYTLKDTKKAIEYYQSLIKRIKPDDTENHIQMKVYCESRINELKETDFWKKTKKDSIMEANL